ncbi:MAG: hypothetical protein CM1200mP10_26080 [Candidatus Neomarinimicrobiota bacterium]|nr:MAG: hypothetical protein CM1200mP10_26080 [Candidatus Neomarinimicrobiota bacterium]
MLLALEQGQSDKDRKYDGAEKLNQLQKFKKQQLEILINVSNYVKEGWHIMLCNMFIGKGRKLGCNRGFS